MDYLIKKSDSSIVQKWSNTVGKIQLPEQSGGDVIFTGDERPLDLGDYFLIKAKEVEEALDDATPKTKKHETEVVVDGNTVTITKKAVARTVAEIAQEKIGLLEHAVTPRRLRDAHLTADGKTWLDDQEKLIAVERAKL
tara:strand:- start:13 stop:429 length:417 start_codon:yes stop_codon:yes gene_type:complete